MSESPRILTRNLTVRYGRLTAVRDVSITVPEGSVYALLGRNGAGKSSFIRTLLGYRKPSAGQVLIDGRSPWKERVGLMSLIGVVPEEPDAPPDMRVSDLLDFSRRLYPRWNDTSVRQRLERFGVSRTSRFGSLSKGQKGQTGLALALGHDPQLLILDDPTMGLDVVARHSFFDELIAELADRGTTVFITTHDLAAIEGLADKVAILRDGQLVVEESVESLKSRFRKIRFVRKNGGAAVLTPLVAIRTRALGAAVEAEVADFEESRFLDFQSRSDIDQAEAGPMSLEEIFMAMVGEKS
jgi:ABC-2 type transport system ATP-binding protein